ncbi:helix-turn-helix domain-containing protein [Streptomyces sp. NBC_01795]|uniref:helix-turn-helix domain-containing protein n=1 Tax=Streptomyces sp. NBC_01795 TaxID=2975943 RepID=UPI002DD836C5|nr:helix-turn-helix transcriptional regulator [Streptomyces sp. NBC_01795]WSA95513.1 helix-turn-helix domain-containing protein [Streptomyces sp. NBC_01795]
MRSVIRLRSTPSAEHEAPGQLVRRIRREQGVTLEQLGQKSGYSAAQLSRLERGLSPMTVEGLRRFADALGIPPRSLGPLLDTLSGRHDELTVPYPRIPVPTLRGREDGESVRRRQFLAGSAAVAASAGALPVDDTPAQASEAQLGEVLVARLRDAMLGLDSSTSAQDSAHLAAELDHAHRDYRTCGYASLAVRLPRLIPTAHAASTTDHALLGRGYLLATRLLIKLDEQQLGWMAADRARQLAAAAGEPLVVAESARQLAVLARKAGWHDQALTLALNAADAPELREAGAPGTALRGLLVQSAAYTAAWNGDPVGMRELTAEAAALASSLGDIQLRDLGGFSPATVQLHLVSAENSVGDPARALAAAHAIDPAALPSTERRARLYTDMAHAHHRWGHRDACVTSLLAAERCAPQETHARPAVQALVSGLLLSGRTTPDLRGLATRFGAFHA